MSTSIACARRPWFAAVLLILGSIALAPGDAQALVFRGCFASGPDTDGTADADLDGAVDGLVDALVGTGSWNAGNATRLKNASRAAIEDCVKAAQTASRPGDEFVFYFVGHGADNRFADAAEANESAGIDNHIRIGNTAGGAEDRMTDDQMTTLLSGFRHSVTVSVILNSCYSHTFFDGANDLQSMTQNDGGNPVAAGDHLALVSASTAENPKCTTGFTDRLIDALKKDGGYFKGDTNRDGWLTTEEAARHAQGYLVTGAPLCDDASCDPVSPTQQGVNYRGEAGCQLGDEVCTRIAVIPEPAPWLLLTTLAIVGLARRRRLRSPSAG